MGIKWAMTTGFQLTLAIIKPHAVKVPSVVHNIRRIILSNDFYVLNTKEVTMTREEAGRFYQEHKRKFFHNRLVTLMSSGPSYVHILAKENAIEKWREIIGPTKVYRTQFSHPESIRGRHGLSDTRNVVHGSDSVTSAVHEINFFFPGFDVEGTVEKLVKTVSKGTVIFDEDNFVHHFTS